MVTGAFWIGPPFPAAYAKMMFLSFWLALRHRRGPDGDTESATTR